MGAEVIVYIVSASGPYAEKAWSTDGEHPNFWLVEEEARAECDKINNLLAQINAQSGAVFSRPPYSVHQMILESPRPQGRVEIEKDHIALLDENDKELIYWDEMEWQEDNSVFLSIANAIRILWEEGPEKIREMVRINL